eukprot:CAMPEP_0170740756 /NCGR_PEP_ID=MMETSP0437-20130122/5848_1 /TAXON_ID=0 /ORGANISM="Sexangularia sp." /LENGTH=845 /DNA_ID=CAMNT_0011079267 /DNA_START=57 /DNA_END=2594 /DNA_ORIENTATION=-
MSLASRKKGLVSKKASLEYQLGDVTDALDEIRGRISAGGPSAKDAKEELKRAEVLFASLRAQLDETVKDLEDLALLGDQDDAASSTTGKVKTPSSLEKDLLGEKMRLVGQIGKTKGAIADGTATPRTQARRESKSTLLEMELDSLDKKINDVRAISFDSSGANDDSSLNEAARLKSEAAAAAKLQADYQTLQARKMKVVAELWDLRKDPTAEVRTKGKEADLEEINRSIADLEALGAGHGDKSEVSFTPIQRASSSRRRKAKAADKAGGAAAAAAVDSGSPHGMARSRSSGRRKKNAAGRVAAAAAAETNLVVSSARKRPMFGYLHKQSGSKLHPWDRRYFRLDRALDLDGEFWLRWYESERAPRATPLNGVRCRDICVVPVGVWRSSRLDRPTRGPDTDFGIVSARRIWAVSAECAADAADWVSAIECAGARVLTEPPTAYGSVQAAPPDRAGAGGAGPSSSPSSGTSLESVVLEGPLSKMGGGALRRWQSRSFSLTNRGVFQWRDSTAGDKNDVDARVRNSLAISSSVRVIAPAKLAAGDPSEREPFEFQIELEDSKAWHLRAESGTAGEQWIAALRAAGAVVKRTSGPSNNFAASLRRRHKRGDSMRAVSTRVDPVAALGTGELHGDKATRNRSKSIAALFSKAKVGSESSSRSSSRVAAGPVIVDGRKLKLREVIDLLMADSPDLTRLDLTLHTTISNDHVTAIGAALGVSTHLRELCLSNCRIIDSGAVALATGLAANQSLRSLDVSHNKIGADGLTALAKALARNTTLEELDIFGNTEPGDSTMTELATSLRTNVTLLRLTYRTTSRTSFTISKALVRNKEISRRIAEGTPWDDLDPRT